MGQTHLYLIRTHRTNSRAAEQQQGAMEVILIQRARRRRAQQQQQQLQQHQQAPQRQRRMQERIFCPRTTVQGLREHDIIQRYRLNWQAIQQLLRNIEQQLAPTLVTPRTIPTETKLLAILHMLASGSFQTTGALVGGISQPSFSAFLPKVLDAIIRLTPRHICFPNTLQKQQETKQGFYAISGFPHVLGAIDCTHVHLVPPAATEHLYRNRKHTHYINVQAIVDHQGLITNIVAKYPGSVHDSYIFRHCTINEHFQDGWYGNGLLVADQGYRIQPWIMTPFGNPSTAAECAYNEAHRRTRSIVEWTFGILKSRFRCLDNTGGSLLYSPEMGVILTLAGGGSRPPSGNRQKTVPRSKDRSGHSGFPTGLAGDRRKSARQPSGKHPSHEDTGSELSRRSGKVRREQLHPSRISVSARQTLKFFLGPSYGGPCSAHAIGVGTAGAPRGLAAPPTAILFPAGEPPGTGWR
ncbi:hypothetical protein NDU88_007264 [Pleurodeles waltl]|uniref:Putative nuclease HARBI1 n=1 Tax=Pleurodeles waltl TaxID=8319 RepID=A0AAV7VP78_PLEWA|nr:hypothetical protein NDU88_007264 [Pleurodeles waltl]